MSVVLQEVYQRLFDAFGPQNGGPATPSLKSWSAPSWCRTRTGKTSSGRSATLRGRLLDPHALYEVHEEELEELIRPAGYYRVKAKRLRSLLQFLVERYDGSIDAMFLRPLDQLRQELLGIHGVGPETADSILLYAGSLPTFVVDAYTYRIFTATAGSTWSRIITRSRNISTTTCRPTPPCSTSSTPCWSTWENTIARRPSRCARTAR